jgi:hypothetical protein
MRDDPSHPGKHMDPETGIWSIREWGAECGRGFGRGYCWKPADTEAAPPRKPPASESGPHRKPPQSETRPSAIRPDAVQVELNYTDMKRAAAVGAMRQLTAVVNHLPDSHGRDGSEGWNGHIEGAAAEVAVGLHFHLDWSGDVEAHMVPDDSRLVHRFSRRLHGADQTLPDNGQLVEVRSAPEVWKRLIVRPDDADDRAFVLVVGSMPMLYIQGWMLGRNAKRDEWLADPQFRNTGRKRPDAFFVPSQKLMPAESLRDFLEAC